MVSGKQPTDRIPLVEPAPSILTSARLLSGVDWSNGLAWTPSCEMPVRLWEECEQGTKVLDTVPEPVGTPPFTIYLGAECVNVIGSGDDRLVSLVSDQVTVQTAAGIARALWMGEGLSDDADAQYGLPPTLRRSATDASIGGVASRLDDAVAHLLAMYESCTGGAGGAVFHMPTVLIPGALGGGDGGARVAWPEGNLYRGPLGSVISPGPGYPHGHIAQGAGAYGPQVDDDPETYAGNGFDEVWIYVTGPVEYGVGPVTPQGTDAERRSGSLRTNRYLALVEREAIVRFDPCCVFAAKVINTAGEVS